MFKLMLRNNAIFAFSIIVLSISILLIILEIKIETYKYIYITYAVMSICLIILFVRSLQKEKKLLRNELTERRLELSGELEILNEKLEKNYALKGVEGIHKNLIEEYEKRIDEMNEVLKKANISYEKMVSFGIAEYFSEKNEAISSSKNRWMSVFVICIIALIVTAVGIYMWNKDIKDIVIIVSRYSIMGPMIWFTWLAARNYTQFSKLKEDYSYKAILTLTYDTYSNSSTADDEIKRQILLATIGALKDNPVRLMEKKETCTPAQELSGLLRELSNLKSITDTKP